VSCNFDVLKCRIVVYLGEDRIWEAIDDIFNRELIVWRHVLFDYEGRMLINDAKRKELNKSDDLH
jgi:hypothetical protein